MNIHELDSYNLGDAVKFHRRLNPRIWGRDEHLLPEVREKLLAIAADFQEFLGVEDLDVQDVTVSGSNAAYSYTKNSDIDLHLVVTMPDNPVYQELFNAKKYQYNDEHNIKIGGADVELYVQPADQAHHSQGIYSVRDNEWQQIPQRKRAQVDDACVRDKTADLDARIHAAVKSKNIELISTLWDKIKAMRQAGLEQHGEFGCENIAFKMLRNSGCIKLLKDAMMAAQDRELSLREAGKTQPRFRYGFSEGHQGQPYSSEDGVAASTKQFLEDSSPDTNLVHEFIQHVAMELGIDPLPEIHLHTDPKWSTHNHSFGRYDPDSHTLNVSMPNRHILDVLRTVAHELVHCSQNQQHGGLPDDAGETGSDWENDANARAGIIMRDWANSHPDHFELPALEESASGYIPKNKREAKMPQYAMALSVDIKPGEVGRQANKLALKTGRNGEPGLLQPDAQNLLREFAEFTEEQENLFEISMSPTSLKKLSAQTGALAGMEFEMCVPNTEGGDDGGDLEPDYEYDERCRSIDDAVQFFHDGDYNGRRDVERLRDRMQNDFQEWLDDKLYREWERSGEEYLEEWVPNNVDESEWNPDGLEGDDRQEALAEFIANMHADPGSSDAFDEFRDEQEYDESDWLDDEDLDRMSSIENTYSMSWPHWASTGSGETSIEEVADSFSNAVGRPVQASGSYHSGRVERPSTKNPHYLVEPDSSIDVDDRDDRGLEFVSPPLPIEELLSDLNKVKAWADKTGCYTNDSTGLHINVSVPGWTQGTDQLDYVKLAVLLGDEHVLESFGRAGNTYCKSAMGKIVDIVRQRPDRAQLLMNRMKKGLDQLATRLVHSRQTDKYTSINMKDGYIEFRSPGGDWLNDNFAEIDNTLRRFTVAMSAAVDPEAYRKEYLKKLYKLLDVGSEKDPLSYFAKYAAGELPKAALKSFVRQAQLQRGVTRGKDTRPMWWRVYKEGKDARNSAVIEVVASSKEEALDKAAKDWGVFSDEYRRAMYAEPVRPYKQEGRLVTLTGRPSNPDGNYVIVNAATQAPAYRYMASDMTDATLVLRQWITANPGTQWDFKRDPEMRLGQPGQQQSQGVDTSKQYELYDRRSGAAVATFDAADDDAAMEKLDQFRAGQVRTQGITVPQANEIYGVRSSGIVRRQPQAPAAQQQSQGVDTRVDYELYSRASGAVIDTFPARNDDEARIRLDDYRQHGAGQSNPDNFGVRRGPGVRASDAQQYIPGSTMDLQRQRAAAAQQPAPQPAGMGQWNGQWKVLVNGQEVYRFGNIGNSQADANRIAAAWLRQNGQGVSGEGFEVYPVMAESLREYRMPQPSHGPGAIKDLNEPLGPETPPEMPDGTIKVDVSDMYDWYKLGQKISDLDSIKPGELGSGPPSTVFAFGSEDLENMYSHELTRLGLKTHDLDEPGEEDLDESQLDEDVENFPIANVRKANGAIGNQGVNTNQAADVLTHAAGMQVSPDWTMRQMVDALKADPAAQQRLRQFVQQNPVTVYALPDGSYHLQDGHHRTFLLNLLGDETVPAVVKEDVTEAKTVEFEGLTLKVIKQGHELVVDALDDWGNKVLGHVKFNIGDGRELDPQDLRVDDKYQGQGIARVMYDYVKSLGYTINRSWDQTDAGAGFWDKHRGKEVRVWEQGMAEARKNPEQNTKYQSGWAELAAWASKNNVWLKPHEWAISMTYVPKLGINPGPGISEDTPRGIYFYPFHWAYSVKMDKEALPWADNAPYIQLFQYSTGTELYDPNQIPLASVVAQLKNYGITDEDIAAEKENYPGISTYNLLVWCLGRKYDDNKRVSILNKVLRNLGYDYMIDNGKGWIAINEPTQGVVLNPKIIDKVVTFNNYTRKKEQGMAENFADGKNPGRKGLSKRVGVNTKASVSDLRKTAKNSSGEKQRMAHWLANMKAGRAKAKRK